MKACHACSRAFDPAALCLYPWPDEDGICDEPIPPLFEVDIATDIAGFPRKVATVCHACFHRLQPDLWSCREHWESLDPATPYDALPAK